MLNAVLNKVIGAPPSKKILVAIVGVALIVAAPKLGLDASSVEKAINLLMLWMGGQSIVDATKAFKGPEA